MKDGGKVCVWYMPQFPITYSDGMIKTYNCEQFFLGLGPDGTYGLFPANYVELLDE